MNHLTAHAEIDYIYWVLKRTGIDLKERSPITRTIDKASGYDNYRIKDVTRMVRRIIKLKKQFEWDYSYDEKMLTELNKIKE